MTDKKTTAKDVEKKLDDLGKAMKEENDAMNEGFDRVEGLVEDVAIKLMRGKKKEKEYPRRSMKNLGSKVDITKVRRGS